MGFNALRKDLRATDEDLRQSMTSLYAHRQVTPQLTDPNASSDRPIKSVPVGQPVTTVDNKLITEIIALSKHTKNG